MHATHRHSNRTNSLRIYSKFGTERVIGNGKSGVSGVRETAHTCKSKLILQIVSSPLRESV